MHRIGNKRTENGRPKQKMSLIKSSENSVTHSFLVVFDKKLCFASMFLSRAIDNSLREGEIAKRVRFSIVLVEFSGNIGRNGFLTSIASQKNFRLYFQKSRLEYYFLCLFYFSSPFSGHLRSHFVVLLLLLTARSRRTRKADQKCPEKQDKKSKRDMKIYKST